jgi:hypothetical protein
VEQASQSKQASKQAGEQASAMQVIRRRGRPERCVFLVVSGARNTTMQLRDVHIHAHIHVHVCVVMPVPWHMRM